MGQFKFDGTDLVKGFRICMMCKVNGYLVIVHNSSDIGTGLPIGFSRWTGDPFALVVVEIVLQSDEMANFMRHSLGRIREERL